MERLIHLLKEHQVGTWCKGAAWMIAAIMVIESILDILFLRSQQFQFGVFEVLRFLLANLSTMLFYFFLLYAAGVVVNRLVALSEQDETEQHQQERAGMADEVQTEASSGQG